jgi:poly-gamma-glutamate synthesis protein (capsule biosynthesis protein)
MDIASILTAIFAFFVPFIPTHVVSFDAGMTPPPLPHAQVLFVGDMMFDRTVRTTMDKKGGDYIFSCIDPLLSKQDLVVGNLEGPITDDPSVSDTTLPGDDYNMTFTFAPSTASLLFAHNIKLVNLGNNHILNFNRSGALYTIAYLKEAGVDHFGDPIHATVAGRTVKGVRFAFINYNEFAPGGWRDAASTTLAQVAEAKASGEVPVVYTHWGIEYATTSPQRIHDLAHRFVDAGAVIVIGSHPHVVEEHEVYKGATIYYSLGNFIFDQYWTDTVDHGLTLEVSFKGARVESVKEIPVVLQHDRRTCAL